MEFPAFASWDLLQVTGRDRKGLVEQRWEKGINKTAYVCGGDAIDGTKIEAAPETLNDLSSLPSLPNYQLSTHICSYVY